MSSLFSNISTKGVLSASVYAKMKAFLNVQPKVYERFLYGLPYPI